jgi:hypothetical protein
MQYLYFLVLDNSDEKTSNKDNINLGHDEVEDEEEREEEEEGVSLSVPHGPISAEDGSVKGTSFSLDVARSFLEKHMNNFEQQIHHHMLVKKYEAYIYIYIYIYIYFSHIVWLVLSYERALDLKRFSVHNHLQLLYDQLVAFLMHHSSKVESALLDDLLLTSLGKSKYDVSQ